MYNLYSYSTSQKSVVNFKDEYLDKYRFLMISSNVFKLRSLKPIKFNFYKKNYKPQIRFESKVFEPTNFF